ncbi:hypothetical protein [Vibrio phage LP.2]|nr:hypothetical protein [Vibrio phage LP.2]
MRKILIVLITTLVFGMVAQYTMHDINQILDQQTRIQRRGRRSRNKRDEILGFNLDL